VAVVTAEVIRFPVERRLPPQLLTLTELRVYLGMSERWIRYRCAEGMPVRRYGSRMRFRVEDVDAWLRERYPNGAS
jgi:hypothetical protein